MMRGIPARVSSGLLAFSLLGVACVQPPEEVVGGGSNQPPRILSLTATPARMSVGETSSISVLAEDPEQRPLSYSWVATTGDVIGEGSQVRFAASFCCTGTNYVQVTVRDEEGSRASQRVEVFIEY